MGDLNFNEVDKDEEDEEKYKAAERKVFLKKLEGNSWDGATLWLTTTFDELTETYHFEDERII